MNRKVPIVLKSICTMPTRLASLEEPMEQINNVTTQVPKFIPIIIGYTRLKVMAPVADSACNMPTMAEELWTTTVSTSPIRIERIG